MQSLWLPLSRLFQFAYYDDDAVTKNVMEKISLTGI